MTTWFSSDTHLLHTNIIKYSNRPYDDVYHMTEELVKNWNNVVDVDDDVYVLGDVAMGERSKSIPHIARLNGRLHLIHGNHDNCHPMYKDKKSYQESVDLYSQYFFNIQETDCFGPFNLSHFPYHDIDLFDYKSRDFTEWQLTDDGIPLLCGHVHEAWAEKMTSKGTLMINVGVDVRNYTPISYEEICKIAASYGVQIGK